MESVLARIMEGRGEIFWGGQGAFSDRGFVSAVHRKVVVRRKRCVRIFFILGLGVGVWVWVWEFKC